MNCNCTEGPIWVPIVNMIAGMFAIASAFCWFQSSVARNATPRLKLAAWLDKKLGNIPAPTWNWLAALLTAIAVLLQGVALVASNI